MKYRWDKKYLYWGVTALVVVTAAILIYYVVNNMGTVSSLVSGIFNLLMPFSIGLAIAYLLNPIMMFFETKCFKKLFAKTKLKNPNAVARVISLILTMLLFVAFLVGLLFLVIPQLVDSIKGIIANSQTYVTNLHDFALGIVKGNEEYTAIVNDWFDNIGTNVFNTISSQLLPRLSNILSGVTTGVMNVASGIVNFFVGIIVAVYVLNSKKKFGAQTKKITFAVFPVNFANELMRVTRQSDKVFGGFIKGKLIDSFIIGCLCFLGMTIFGMPYALLISVIIFVFNNIPFFGPIIGAVPSALLILMVNPWQALWFVVFIIILQQFDGNILGPKILGESTGLSSFWVIFSIMVFGGLFGFIGMVIGVPLFAVIYTLISEAITKKLKKKKLPEDTECYSKLTRIDPNLNCPVYVLGKGDDADMKIISSELVTIDETEESKEKDKKVK